MNRRIVLWRHADAGDPVAGRDADFARPLSALGRAQAAGVARWIATRLPAPLRVVCSPAPRTRQTATALAADPTIDVRLAPDTGVDAYLALLDESAGSSPDGTLVIVGHQPMIGGVAASLLGVSGGSFDVAKAGCWCFSTAAGSGRRWRLDAAMHPDMVDPASR